MNQLGFNFVNPTLPPLGTVHTDREGRHWILASVDETHANLFRTDIPRPIGKTCPWNNAHGEALGWALPTARFVEEFT